MREHLMKYRKLALGVDVSNPQTGFFTEVVMGFESIRNSAGGASVVAPANLPVADTERSLENLC
jgi:hypothetical protein